MNNLSRGSLEKLKALLRKGWQFKLSSETEFYVTTYTAEFTLIGDMFFSHKDSSEKMDKAIMGAIRKTRLGNQVRKEAKNEKV